jgi:hypothetical protein
MRGLAECSRWTRNADGIAMTLLAFLLATALLPQQPPPAAPPVTVDPVSGWPVLPGTPPAAPPAAEPAPAGTGARADAAMPRPPEDAFGPLFRQVGPPEACAALGGVVARLRFHLFDDQGAELASYEAFHEADLAVPDRDRLVFTESRRVFGRDGSAAWATVHNVLWPSMQQEAREQVELLGFLLRSPWGFADQERFVVVDRTELTVRGRTLARIRIESRAPAVVHGPEPARPDVDRYELYCDARSGEPVELCYARRDGAGQRRVLLQDHQPLGGTRIPMRRTWLDEEGRRRLEIETVRIEADQRLRADQFRPPER